MKKVTFGGKPTGATPNHVDDWVLNRETTPREPTKRFTIDVPVSLHKRIKASCAMRNVIMADVIRDLLSQHFPTEPGQGASS